MKRRNRPGRLKRLYGFLRRFGHPVVWLALLTSLYGNHHYREHLYWETPSIPFRPFCAPGDDWSPFRPIKGVTMSRKYQEAVVRELAEKGITMNVMYRFPPSRVTGPNPNPILISPKDYNDTSRMLRTTKMAVVWAVGWDGTFMGREIDGPGSVSLICEEVEGKIKEF